MIRNRKTTRARRWPWLVLLLGAGQAVIACRPSRDGEARPAAPAQLAPGIVAPEYLAPSIMTPQGVVEEALRLAAVGPGDVVYDLGCGDGRFVVTAAKVHGARGVGIDLDPRQVELARANARAAGVESLVELRTEDLLQSDFADATVVTIYLAPRVNERLKPRLEAQLKPGTRVVSHDFDITGWHFEKRLTLRDENGIQRDLYFWVIGRQTRPPVATIHGAYPAR